MTRRRTDVAVFRPSTGTWITSPVPSSDHYDVVNFGAAGDVPLRATMTVGRGLIWQYSGPHQAHGTSELTAYLPLYRGRYSDCGRAEIMTATGITLRFGGRPMALYFVLQQQQPDLVSGTVSPRYRGSRGF